MEEITTFIENKVTLKKGEKEFKLKQKVSFTSIENSHEFEFVDEFPNADGSDVNVESIFSVDKRPDKSYEINITKCGIFKDSEGHSILDVIPNTDGTAKLEMKPESSKISLSSKGEQICFEFIGSDGKNYSITTSATSITINYDGKDYFYQTDYENQVEGEVKPAIGVNINTTAFADFLDKNESICKTPKNILKDFPSHLLGLYASRLRGNSVAQYGDYTITSIDMEDDKTKQPYVFVTKTNSEDYSNSTYLYINGVLKKCNKYLCQYTQVGDRKESPSVVLEVSPQKITEKSTMKYYPLPIKLTDDGNISEESSVALRILDNIMTRDNSDKGEESAYSIIDPNTYETFNFFKRDDREYAKDYHFRIKPKNIEVEPIIIPTSENEEVENPIEKEDEVEESKAEEKEPEKPKEVKLKNTIQPLTNLFIFGGLSLAAGAMLTGFGLLAGIGLALGVGGVVLGAFEENIKFKRPIKKAKKKIAEYSKQALDDAVFEEYFASQEATLDQVSEIAEERENALRNILHDQSNAMYAFSEAYNDYGVGYEGMIDEGQERIDALILNTDNRKVILNETFSTINKTTDINVRNKLIDNFIFQNFENLPSEKEEKVRKIFNPENHEAFMQFSNALKTTVEAQEEKNKIYNSQKEDLTKATDRQVYRVAQSKLFDSEKRGRFFERYSSTIVKHFASDKNPTQEKITKIVENLSIKDKGKALTELNYASDKTDKRIKNISILAKDNHEKISKINECKDYLHAMYMIQTKQLSTLAETEIQTTDFFSKLTALNHKSSKITVDEIHNAIDKNNTLSLKLTTIEQKNANAKLLEILNMSNSSVLTSNYKDFLQEVKDQKLVEEIVKIYTNNSSYGSILPNLEDVQPESKYTLEEIAKNLGNEKLKEAVNRYNAVRRIQIQELEYKVSELAETLDILDNSIGFAPSIDPTEVNNELNKIKNEKFKNLSHETQVKLATARLKAQKIQSSIATVGISQEVAELYSQVNELTNLVSSGKIINHAVNNAVNSALDIEEDVDAKSLQIQGHALNVTINNYNNVIGIAKAYSKAPHTTNIINAFNDAKVSHDAKQKLRDAFVNEYGNEQLRHYSISFEDIFNKLSVENKISIEKIDEFIDKNTNTVNNHTKTNLHTMEDILDIAFINQEYNRRLKDEKENRSEEERYDSILDLLVNKFNVNEEQLHKEILEGKISTKELLKKFDFIDKDEFKKASKNIRNNAYSEKDQFEIWQLENKLEKFAENASMFDMAWNSAIHGNATDLENYLNDEKNKSTLDELGIDVEKIQKVLNSKSGDKISLLINIENEDNLLDRSERAIKFESERLKKLKALASLPSKADRNLYTARTNLDEFKKNKEEFLAKLNALEKLYDKGLSDKKIHEAFVAFAKGDEKYFLNHPEIKCEGFEFSKFDPELINQLGIDFKKLTAKKKYANLFKIKDFLKKKETELEEKVKEQVQASTSEDQKGKKLNKVSEVQVKDNLSLIGKLFEKLLAKHKEENPRVTVQEQHALEDEYANIDEDENENE